ncbi:MAG: 3-deoxy-manno-octulosonate cytidylyltransferase [Magnetococcales bacterium]|nr:3-deoxy-manno-octulosonate cytidylyltransferase [Magnetococcales bacterium]MBF0157039.1 3-deoxy-manno-octulosonate cytidylyltransferase [Magnetococcales bacterium]
MVLSEILVVIPARYASTRLPGKALAEIAGKPMIRHVYERASQARVGRVLVATDDLRIARAVTAFGGEAVMTSPEHPSGTDRIAEAIGADFQGLVVNVQGDEPMLVPGMIDEVVAPLVADPGIPMGTLAHLLTDAEEFQSRDVVKVVTDRRGFALYFSRAPIPCHRDGVAGEGGGPFRHVGLYAYRADFLRRFSRLPPTPLEQAEKLEQLRALEHGYPIRVVTTSHRAVGVDTPEDLEKVRRRMAVG